MSCIRPCRKPPGPGSGAERELEGGWSRGWPRSALPGPGWHGLAVGGGHQDCKETLLSPQVLSCGAGCGQAAQGRQPQGLPSDGGARCVPRLWAQRPEAPGLTPCPLSGRHAWYFTVLSCSSRKRPGLSPGPRPVWPWWAAVRSRPRPSAEGSKVGLAPSTSCMPASCSCSEGSCWAGV